jgi:pimeloyl-ACP methyl ester carboxylesterase
MRVIFVHGACVQDADWWWCRMVSPLAAAGLASLSVELPSCLPAGEHGAPSTLPDLYDDVAAVKTALRANGEPALLVGHSYGGTVITEAAAGEPSAAGLFYLTSMMPDVGESMAAVTAGGGPSPWMDPEAGPEGTIGVHPEHIRELFLDDCDEAAVEGAVARLTVQTAAVFGQPLRAAAWRDLPSTYAVCGGDRAIPAADQRARGARAGRLIELPTGHHPMLSHPDLLAAAIVSAVAGSGGVHIAG